MFMYPLLHALHSTFEYLQCFSVTEEVYINNLCEEVNPIPNSSPFFSWCPKSPKSGVFRMDKKVDLKHCREP